MSGPQGFSLVYLREEHGSELKGLHTPNVVKICVGSWSPFSFFESHETVHFEPALGVLLFFEGWNLESRIPGPNPLIAMQNLEITGLSMSNTDLYIR